ncbi:MAG: WYL domain-containing protein [Muribaculaceae bacterium]|nr:WYL domain-containing protein [Muribaculaceae bacterium]
MLAEKLPEYGMQPVSKRCVEKDINYLEYDSPFDVEIEEYWMDAADCNDRPYRKRCVRYADPTFSIFKPKLSEDEKTVLSSALETLGSFEGLENFEWLNDLQHRLGLESHQSIISFSKNILTNSTLIASLFTAIRLKRVITLHYHKFGCSEVRSVEITPHLLKEYNNRWFLIVSACDTGKILTFALDRIDSFEENHKALFRKAAEDLVERFEDMIGVTYNEDASVEKIVFWVSDFSKEYIKTKPLHGSQRCLRYEREIQIRNNFPDLYGGELFQIECMENYELIQALSSYGPELVVLEPVHIREKIFSRMSQMVKRYKDIYK